MVSQHGRVQCAGCSADSHSDGGSSDSADTCTAGRHTQYVSIAASRKGGEQHSSETYMDEEEESSDSDSFIKGSDSGVHTRHLCHRFLHCNRAEEDRTGHCLCWSLMRDGEPAWPLPSA
jgi:hypothetical protein